MKDTTDIASHAQVLLFSPPWMKAGWPCLGIAALKSCLTADGIAVQCTHFHLETAARLGWENYDALAEVWGPGEALFGALVDPDDAARLTAYAGDELRAAGHEALADWAEGPACAELMRLIDHWIDDTGALMAPIIGVSVGAMQLCGAIYLLQRLAQRGHRGARVLGGSGLVGSGGIEVLRRVAEVDYVVHGEGEETFRRLVHALLDGANDDLTMPGVSSRTTPSVSRGPAAELARLPAPDLTEYFATASRFGIPRTALNLSFEHSRGCEWEHRTPGKLRGCTFCGLYRGSSDFRRKPVAVLRRQIQESVNRYHNLNVAFVDAYLTDGNRDALLDALNSLPEDITFFSELRPDMSPETVARLARRARHVQLGVESFSTDMLRQIGKGVSGAHSIYNLRLCQEAGISLQYNLMHGIPGVTETQVGALAASLPTLFGLIPPQPSRLYLDRNSLLYRTPAAYGIDPLSLDAIRHEWLAHVLGDNAISPVVSFAPTREVSKAWDTLEDLVRSWKTLWQHTTAAGIASPLLWRAGSGWASISDVRDGTLRAFDIDGLEHAVFLACDSVVTAEKIARLIPDHDASEIATALAQLVKRGLVFRDGTRYVRVAIRDCRDGPLAPARTATHRRTSSDAS